MNPEIDCDIVIVGAGLVGAAFALAMSGSGLRVTLVESASPPTQPQNASWDSRIYAISPGNAAFLKRLGAWDEMDQTRINPIYAMQVWGDGKHAYLEFDAYEAGVETLGYIVESRQMQMALWQALKAQPDIKIFCPAQCKTLEFAEQAVTLQLAGGHTLRAQLIVAADGGNSWARSQAGIVADTHEYSQLGVVANFVAEKPHGNTARQWFRPDGVLAWLPLPGNRISMVWSSIEAQARELLALDGVTLCERVAQAGGYALGALQLETSPAGFPLSAQIVSATVKHRLALIGDAAHLVHPLAGQGVNLGLRDARCLADVLFGRDRRADVGDFLLLRRYERARKPDVLATWLVTDKLQKLFNNGNPWLSLLRTLGLRLSGRRRWLRRWLMAQAMI